MRRSGCNGREKLVSYPDYWHGKQRCVKKMLRVLIADDHPLIRIGLAKVLAQRPATEIEQAGTIPEFREALARSRPDVLVLDLNMPGGNTLEVIPELRRLYPKLGILVLSVHPEQQAGIKAILAGANGYLNKSSAPDQLLQAVDEVSKGGRYVSQTLGVALAEYLFRGRSGRQPHETLSDREYAVLLRIAKGYTTSEIAVQLNLSPKTVGTYRARVLEKMGISTTAELTRYVIEKGLDENSD
jgi:DNA-binding NarL/FixJ family response regulator